MEKFMNYLLAYLIAAFIGSIMFFLRGLMTGLEKRKIAKLIFYYIIFLPVVFIIREILRI